MGIPKRWLLRLVNLWPPYLGAGIRVRFDPDFRWAEASMRLGLFNRNYFGTHFGGSLYAMVDPLVALLLAERLGPGYLVWDKAASIRFVKPGRGRVRARVEIDDAWVDEVRRDADAERTVEPGWVIEVRDEQDDVVAVVDKLLWVRRVKGRRAAGEPVA